MSRPTKSMARHIDHEALTIWQLLLKEGGYWKVREVGDALNAAPVRRNLRFALDRLSRNGMLRSRQAPGKHPSFGVTPTCKAPPGYAWMLEVAIHGEQPIDWAALEREHA